VRAFEAAVPDGMHAHKMPHDHESARHVVARESGEEAGGLAHETALHPALLVFRLACAPQEQQLQHGGRLSTSQH